MLKRKELATVLRVSENTVDIYRKEGMPHEVVLSKVKGHRPLFRYDYKEVVSWMRKKGKFNTLHSRRRYA